MLKGSFVAIITPFKGGAIHYEKLEELIDFHIKNGTNGIVPCGTTGESATLSHDEHKKLIEFVIKKVNKRIPVIAGSGSNSTREAIELAQFAKEAGADAHLSITPYYNKPSQEGLFRHFKAIADAVALPMVVYNVPGRTGVNLCADTMGRLSEVPNIVGLKEATGDMKQASEIMERVKSGFSLLSGDDFTTLPMLALGGTGAISVTANVMPKESSLMFEYYESGDTIKAKSIHYNMQALHRVMFIDTNPIPVKTAVYLMGLIDTLEFRLPLCEMKKENEDKLKAVMKEKGLLK